MVVHPELRLRVAGRAVHRAWRQSCAVSDRDMAVVLDGTFRIPRHDVFRARLMLRVPLPGRIAPVIHAELVASAIRLPMNQPLHVNPAQNLGNAEESVSKPRRLQQRTSLSSKEVEMVVPADRSHQRCQDTAIGLGRHLCT